MNNNYVKVKIEGKSINNYIKWLIKNNISIIKLNIIKHNILEIIINYNDYKKLSKYSKTYKIKIIEKYGKLRLINKLKKNFPLILSIIISIIIVYLLSNIIFSVDIIYNDKEIVIKLKQELEKYDIKKYKRKRNYKYLNKIKEQILNDNKDTLEWIEIEECGTKYVVRVVERKKETKKEEYKYQSIIAKKNSTITSIKAFSGEKIKNINQYVKKGETIISGILTKPDNQKIYSKASGIIYGEVWYKVNIEYPLYYKEEKLTGKSKNVITFKFLNKKIYLFPYKKYKQFKSKSNILIKNNIIPFEIIKEKLYESIIKEQIYTQEEAIEKAIIESKNKVLAKNNNIQEIKEVYILDKENLNSKIKLNLFISAIEDITEIQEIKEEVIENKNTINN